MLIQKTLKEKMPEIEAAMVITDGGELLDYDVSKTFLNENDFKSTEFLTNLVSLRFRIGEFAQLFGGLELTINRFKDKILVSKSLINNYILILILPADVDLEKIKQVLSNYHSYHIMFNFKCSKS